MSFFQRWGLSELMRFDMRGIGAGWRGNVDPEPGNLKSLSTADAKIQHAADGLDSVPEDEVAEVFALGAAFLGDAVFTGRAGLLDALVAERAEQAVHELGRLALFVAREVGLDEGDEVGEGIG